MEYDNVKTIYDPSPIGYKVPPIYAYQGFAIIGDTYFAGISDREVNTPYTSNEDVETNFGWEFFCNRMHGVGNWDLTGGTIFFPLSGSRGNGSLSSSDQNLNYSDSDRYWTASMNFYTGGDSFCLGTYDVYFRQYFETWNGFSLRPVRE